MIMMIRKMIMTMKTMLAKMVGITMKISYDGACDDQRPAMVMPCGCPASDEMRVLQLMRNLIMMMN